MDQQQYGRYLLDLIDAEPMNGDEVMQDDLYGYFQCFMPEEQGIEQVFEPQEPGGRLLERIGPIYAMLNPGDFEGETVPGYFNSGRSDASEERLRAYGQAYMEGLRRLFALEPELAEEAAEALSRVERVTVLEPGAIGPILDDFDNVDEDGALLLGRR